MNFIDTHRARALDFHTPEGQTVTQSPRNHGLNNTQLFFG